MPTARVLDALQVLVPPPDEGGDGECLQRFLAVRDEAAFAELVRRHGPMVYGACRRILANGPEADDAFQATFFVLARRAGSIRGHVRSWLYGVAVRVAHKARVQAVKRRVRQMAAAKPEAVSPTPSEADLWAVLDEELAKLPDDLRQAVLACDVNGLSRSKAAAELGWPEGTVAKRLAKAREVLAARLTRRGISLGVGALSVALVEKSTAAVPGALLLDTARQAVSFALGGGGGSFAVQTLAEGVMRTLKMGVLKMWLAVSLLAVTLAGGSLMLAEGPGEKKGGPPATAAAKPEAGPGAKMWKEKYATEKTGSLPVSVAYSADGKTLLVGDTSGEVMACIFTVEEPQWKWKSAMMGTHAAVAYSADGKKVYATTQDGVRVIDAASGKDESLIEAKDSHAISIGVFPPKLVGGMVTQSRIVFGSARGYTVKSWFENVPNSGGTLETKTVAPGAKPKDEAAVPLAVDPKGRSAILTGPLDPETKSNVLWAYVCGDYDDGSPGNRVMPGHVATVVSAAWAKEGSTAVTGDADGRVITWDTKTMKESRRLELGGRIAALAISDDGRHTAAYVLGQRSEVFVWETAKPTNALKPIHSEQNGFGGPTSHASLSFSPDGQRLAGCAADRRLLNFLGGLNGKVRIWELADEPKAQKPPKPLYTKLLPKGSSSNFAILHNHVLVMPSSKDGAIEYRNPKDGTTYSRIVLGQFTIGGMKVSTDRKWVALEQHVPFDPKSTAPPSRTFDVGIWNEMPWKLHATIPACSQVLDVASGGKVAAVLREKKVELWDVAAGKSLKSVPFPHDRVEAAQFSPDGKLLAFTYQKDLVLWRWLENAYERIELDRSVGSLAFSPDGKLLAEGPTERENISIRDVASRQIAKTLGKENRVWMKVPGMAFSQGGRVLIAGDSIEVAKNVPTPRRINLWDTQTGGLAHAIAIPAGTLKHLDVSPNGRYLVATVEDGGEIKLGAWEIGGGSEVEPPNPPKAIVPPAVAVPPAKLTWKAESPMTDPQFDIQSLAFSPDGSKFAICSNGETLVYDAATLKKHYSAGGCFPKFVDKDLYTWAIHSTQYDAETGKLIKQYPEAKTEFGWQLAAFSPDGKTVAGFDGMEIHLRDVATGFEPVRLARQARRDSTRFPIRGVAWSPDGTRVAGFHMAAERGGTAGLAIWDASSGQRIARRTESNTEFNGTLPVFAFASDGQTVAVGGLHRDNDMNSSLTILDTATMKNVRGPVPVSSRDGGSAVTAVAYSPDGGTIAIGVKFRIGKGPLNRVQLYDAKTLELGESLLPALDTAPITVLAFAPDGRTLIGSTGEGPHSDTQKKETLHRVLIWRGSVAK